MTVFPDTNIFLHCQSIQQIDWPAQCQTNAVKLIVCLQVVDEIDTHTFDTRLSERAKRAHKVIEECLASQVRRNVSLELCDPATLPNDAVPKLDAQSFDNRIVYTVLCYKAQHPEEDVAVATMDRGLRLRCQTHGIKVILIDEKYRLEPPTDELKRQLHHSKTELAQLKNRLPDLDVYLCPVDGPFSIDENLSLKKSAHIPTMNLNEVMRSEKNGTPKLNVTGAGVLANALDDVRGRIVYNQQVDDYYAAVKRSVASFNEWVGSRGVQYDLALVIDNVGNQPATGIEVTIFFPSDVSQVFNYDDKDSMLKDAPVFPTAPRHPELFRPPAFSDLGQIRRADRPKPSIEILQLDEHTAVTFTVNQLIHTKQALLGRLALLFHPDAVSDFEASYNVFAVELPEIRDGELAFRFERD